MNTKNGVCKFCGGYAGLRADTCDECARGNEWDIKEQQQIVLDILRNKEIPE